MGPPDVKQISEITHDPHRTHPPGAAPQVETDAPRSPHSSDREEQPEQSAISSKAVDRLAFYPVRFAANGCGIRNPDPGCCGCGASGGTGPFSTNGVLQPRKSSVTRPARLFLTIAKFVQEFLRPFQIRSRSLPPEPGQWSHSATGRQKACGQGPLPGCAACVPSRPRGAP